MNASVLLAFLTQAVVIIFIYLNKLALLMAAAVIVVCF